eukprot:1894547-Prymnesium_polylepis.1
MRVGRSLQSCASTASSEGASVRQPSLPCECFRWPTSEGRNRWGWRPPSKMSRVRSSACPLADGR